MQFRSELDSPVFPFMLSHSDTVVSIGSCFAEHIAQRLTEGKLPVVLNPFGIVYNPISIARQLDTLVEPVAFTKPDLFFESDLWHSFDHHSVFSGTKPDEVLHQINSALAQGADALAKAKVLIITLGTSFVYELRDSGKVVANCHKVVASRFNKRRLSLDDITGCLADAFEAIFRINPGIYILLTVSPVKHLREGIIENQRSKAGLILAVDALCSRYNNVHYFPAYEYLNDDLRDYRFYESDLAHPNKLAVDYIWKKFEASLLTPETQLIFRRLNSVHTNLRHRPLHPDTAAYQQFLIKIRTSIESLEAEYPFLDFSAEKGNLQALNTFE